MFKPTPFLKAVLALAGALSATMILWQCTARSTPTPVQVLPGSATTTRTAEPTKTVAVIDTRSAATPRPPTAASTASATPAQFPTLPIEIPVLPSDGARAAANLQSSTECDLEEPWKGIVRLSWAVARDRGSEQRVVVTIYRDGFETGKFDASEALPADQSLLVWERLSPGIIQFWMVLTRHGDGWVPSEQSSFEGPVCAVDYVPSPTP
jgi:hypothetical protein